MLLYVGVSRAVSVLRLVGPQSLAHSTGVPPRRHLIGHEIVKGARSRRRSEPRPPPGPALARPRQPQHRESPVAIPVAVLSPFASVVEQPSLDEIGTRTLAGVCFQLIQPARDEFEVSVVGADGPGGVLPRVVGVK